MKKPRSKKKASLSEPSSASPARASASAAPTAQPTVVPAKSSQAAPEVKVAINSSPSAASKPAAPSRPASAPSRERIAARAFALYAERGYRDGRALEDWLEAEREVLANESPSKST